MQISRLRRHVPSPAFLLNVGAVVILLGCSGALGALPMLSSRGAEYVDPQGNQVILKGCNLGNYLMLESWMFGGALGMGPDHAFRDGATVYRTLRERFGPEKSQHLIEAYRDSWITPRDFELIKTFGFNVVRLPFDYRLIQEDQPPFRIKPDAFRWLDHAVGMAEDAGIYVVLDLHGTPGGQSNEDHTGEAGQDHLWNSVEDQQRTVEVWRALAEHFKSQSAVAAYDLINEPYGNHQEDCKPVLARLMPEIYRAVRSTGDQHIVFFSGALNGGIEFYGNPHDQGMTNVGFTEHFYPGLFGSKAALETQARVLNQELPAKQQYSQEIASPYYVGEFNVVLDSEDPGRVMRDYYDRFAQYGWAGTMWSYKLIKTQGGVTPSPWYMVTNARPLPQLDLNSSSYEDLENFFASMATTPLAVYERLRDAVTTRHPGPLYLARYPRLPAAPPSDPPPSDPQGYTSVDLGGARPGYTCVQGDGSVIIMGGGSDIFAAKDACRFVSQPAGATTADVRATIVSFVDSAEYAKAGVMARWGAGDDASAAMAMVNMFPDGTLALISRRRQGAGTQEQKVDAGVRLPVELRLQISGGRARGLYRACSGPWQTIGFARVPQTGDFRTGIAVCSHMDEALTTVRVRLGEAADRDLPPPGEEGSNSTAGPSMLTNGSFEPAADQDHFAANWNRWGDWSDRRAAAPPSAAAGGESHWEILTDGASGIWQDVSAKPGARYAFTIFAQHDHGGEAGRSIELRLESDADHGQITLNSQQFDVDKLASGDSWTRLSVSGTADTGRLRVLAIVPSTADAANAIKFADAKLTRADDGK